MQPKTVPADVTARIVRKTATVSKRNQSSAPAQFFYQPIAPYVPVEAEHSSQRYFSRGNQNFALNLKSGKLETPPFGKYVHTSCDVDAYRHSQDDFVELRIALRFGGNSQEVAVACTANELREIASRLLDAANDLDTFPSHLLARVSA